MYLSTWVKLLSPFWRITGALLSYSGKDIPVQVRFHSEPDSNRVSFNRCFHFPGRAPYRFQSTLAPTSGNHIIEFMRFGLGWRMRLVYTENQVQLQHDGYIWRLFGCDIPVPIRLILGKSHAYEYALSDTEFGMGFDIIHPLLGKVFGYEGKFTLTQTAS